AEFFCGANELRQRKCFAAIPAAQIRDAIESKLHFDFDKGCFPAAHKIALRKIVVKASFSKSQGPWPMKIYTLRAAMRSLVQMTEGISTSHRKCILTSEAIPSGLRRRLPRCGSKRSAFGKIGRAHV